MTHQSIQLEMNFDGTNENTFKRRLDSGDFQVIAELPVPSADTQDSDAVRKYADFEYLIHAQENPNSLIAFTCNTPPGYAMDPVDFASKLCKFAQDRHIIYVSGIDQSLNDIRTMVQHAVSCGFRNFCAVTGQAAANENEEKTRSHVFTESVNILHDLREKMPGPYTFGAVINPYQYTPCSSYAQSFHLFRKIANGSHFITTQFGWDAKKLQELIWNLYRREINIPVIARMLILTPENAEDVCAGRVPGVHLSPDFIQLLRREREHSFVQFQAAQLRRIQIHAAGAKFLGCSAVQLTGTTHPDTLELVFQRIRQGLQEFHSFEEWRAAYLDYYGRIEIAPYPNLFYLFENLLQKERLEHDPGLPATMIPPVSFREKVVHSLSKKLFRHSQDAAPGERLLTKKILAGCSSCSNCRLSETGFVCPELCPKGLSNGSCGENLVNGDCPFTQTECIFAKRIRLATADDDYSSLDEGAVPSLEKR